MTSRHQPVPAISLSLQPVKVKLAMIIRYGIVIRNGCSVIMGVPPMQRGAKEGLVSSQPLLRNEERRRGSRETIRSIIMALIY